MRKLTLDEKTFLEELLVNVKEVEKLVWDDTKTDTVKSMILQIGCKANEKKTLRSLMKERKSRLRGKRRPGVIRFPQRVNHPCF
jgi:hypothetical protein